MTEVAMKKAATETRRQKIANIEGLKAIQEALDAEDDYERAEDESNDGVNQPSKPSVKSADLKAQYPRAAAYLKAREYEFSCYYGKSSAGMKAKDRIINGEDYAQALSDMVGEWSAHSDKQAWN